MLFSFVLSLRKKIEEKVELPRSIKLTSCLSMKQDQKKIMMRGFLFHVVFLFLFLFFSKYLEHAPSDRYRLQNKSKL